MGIGRVATVALEQQHDRPCFYRHTQDGPSLWYYASGTNARDILNLPPELAVRSAKEALLKARPAVANSIGAGTVFSWSEHPFARSTFAFRAPGNLSRLQQSLKAPHGRVHFAGEHTADLEAGIEGALERGARRHRNIVPVIKFSLCLLLLLQFLRI